MGLDGIMSSSVAIGMGSLVNPGGSKIVGDAGGAGSTLGWSLGFGAFGQGDPSSLQMNAGDIYGGALG
jgi:hypothetical protein